jgi:hypothetical protein
MLLHFSDAKAVLNASASRSRRVASDCAIAILAFSPLIATALASDVLHELSLELPLLSSLKAAAILTSLSLLVIAIFHHDLYEFQQFERLSHDQPLLSCFSIFSCSATEILASFIAFAASFLKLQYIQIHL